MKHLRYYIIVVASCCFIIFFFSNCLSGVGISSNENFALRDSSSFHIMFYNTENFFDTYNDSLTDDDEFTPQGNRHWTYKKYTAKLNNIYKVIASTGMEPPQIIGMCEVENYKVIRDLIEKTPLLKFNYKIIHKDSPDPRGIDIAMIYRPDLFRPLKKEFIRIIFPFDLARKTRDILFVKGIANKDTLNIFFNHWPSRSGGEEKSEPYRIYVAGVLKSKTDSLIKVNPHAKIVIMGDFNDEPDNKSIMEGLNACICIENSCHSNLINLSGCLLNSRNTLGTYKFHGRWNILDQVIVTTSLISNKQGFFATPHDVIILNTPFLLKPDKSETGSAPFRTYNGFKYAGGYSDHLPVILNLEFK
jgi:hypothetical protein